MHLSAEIQARDAERARLAAAREAFLAAGGTETRLPGPGERRPSGIDHRGKPVTLPLCEQNQHMHRQPRSRQKVLDQANWENRKALIERYRERIMDAHGQGLSEASISTRLKISRAQVRMIAGAIGITLRQRARRTKTVATEQPAPPDLRQSGRPARIEACRKPKDTARLLILIRREIAQAMASLDRMESRSKRKRA